MADVPSYARFVLRGYSPWPAEKIVRMVDTGTGVAQIPGDFVAIAEGTCDGQAYTRIVTSMVAALPYYFTPGRGTQGPFEHGPTVFDVVRRARLSWRWNRRAISFLALLGHTVGDDTLHPDVFRVPNAAVITAMGGRLGRIERQDDAWRSVFAPTSVTDPQSAVATLRDVFGEMTTPARAVLSLSAGYDSRLLLALLLSLGERPLAITAGFADSTDVVVAGMIARALGLEHRIVELDPNDYLKHARDIVHATSGTKTAAHWHTDLYVRAAGIARDDVHYVGSNGEFARSYYLDRGAFAHALGVGPRALMEAFFAAKLTRRARRLPPALLAAGPGPLACARHLTSLVQPFTRSFADALDCFYATQRVRHFIGNGLALYTQHSQPRSPFLDARWIRAVGGLPRRERLGSNHHRRAIATLLPDLLAFPTGGGGPMARRAPPLYYVVKDKSVGYSPFDRVIRDSRVHEIIAEASALDEIVPRAARVAEARRSGIASELLLTLAFASELGSEAAASGAS